MRLDDLRAIKDRRPFEPFEIHLADGRGIPVRHPDAVAWEGPDFAPTLIVMLPRGRWEVVNFAAITSLSPAGSPAGGNGS